MLKQQTNSTLTNLWAFDLPYQAANPCQPRIKVNESALENVLLAFAAKNSKIGYCQSMSFVAATMLMYMEEALKPWGKVVLFDELKSG